MTELFTNNTKVTLLFRIHDSKSIWGRPIERTDDDQLTQSIKLSVGDEVSVSYHGNEWINRNKQDAYFSGALLYII